MLLQRLSKQGFWQSSLKEEREEERFGQSPPIEGHVVFNGGCNSGAAFLFSKKRGASSIKSYFCNGLKAFFMKPIIIAIDGHSSTGKSTVAKQLAKALDYIYIDTGAMYRAVALYALENDCITEAGLDADKLSDQLGKIHIAFKYNAQKAASVTYLNGQNVEDEIRGMRVSQQVSRVAAIPEVRRLLVKQQQKMGQQKGVVMDGRDIGTVVFPAAELKLFMTASAQTRAERRFKELQAKGEKVNFEEVLENVLERDRMDSNRKDSPLKKAEDAIEIDNSHLTPEEQFEKILQLAQERIGD